MLLTIMLHSRVFCLAPLASHWYFLLYFFGARSACWVIYGVYDFHGMGMHTYTNLDIDSYYIVTKAYFS
jgi:uncharacterized membrane protein